MYMSLHMYRLLVAYVTTAIQTLLSQYVCRLYNPMFYVGALSRRKWLDIAERCSVICYWMIAYPTFL